MISPSIAGTFRPFLPADLRATIPPASRLIMLTVALPPTAPEQNVAHCDGQRVIRLVALSISTLSRTSSVQAVLPSTRALAKTVHNPNCPGPSCDKTTPLSRCPLNATPTRLVMVWSSRRSSRSSARRVSSQTRCRGWSAARRPVDVGAAPRAGRGVSRFTSSAIHHQPRGIVGRLVGLLGLKSSKLLIYKPCWRMGWDSNPRSACTLGGFQDRCLKPLGHPS